jgi:hypothetical protein
VIACYGLFANSPAVVIGAMVVAMLLGPIAGVALGLNESDRPFSPLRCVRWAVASGGFSRLLLWSGSFIETCR